MVINQALNENQNDQGLKQVFGYYCSIVFDYIDVDDNLWPSDKEFSNNNKLYECLVNCKIAFMKLLSTYESNKHHYNYRHSIIDIGEKIGTDYKKLIGTNSSHGEHWFRQITETTNKIREILKISALGIDYKKFTYFEIITPKTFLGWSEGENKYISTPKEIWEKNFNVRKSDCQFCIDFVIDSALKFQGFDYDINNILK